MATTTKPELALIPFKDVAEEHNIPLEVWSAMNSSLYPGAKPQSLVLVYMYCKARNLDVLMKPVHIVPMSVKIGRDTYEYRDIVMPGITLHRITASRTNLMAGSDDPVFGPDTDFDITIDPKVKEPLPFSAPLFAKVTIHRLDQAGVPRSYTHTEYFAEAVAREKSGMINSMWRKRPHGQLAKCAEAGALRKAFPEEIGGEMTAEEMEGKTIGGAGEDAIEGDFTVVSGETLNPVEKKPDANAKPKGSANNGGDGAGKPTGEGTKPAGAGDTPKPAGEASAPEAATYKIDLPAPPLRMLNKMLTEHKMSQADLLAKLSADITLSNINEAFACIKKGVA